MRKKKGRKGENFRSCLFKRQGWKDPIWKCTRNHEQEPSPQKAFSIWSYKKECLAESSLWRKSRAFEDFKVESHWFLNSLLKSIIGSDQTCLVMVGTIQQPKSDGHSVKATNLWKRNHHWVSYSVDYSDLIFLGPSVSRWALAMRHSEAVSI